MAHDPIKYALWIGGFGLAIALVCSVYIVWVNGGSRNLALGLGALVGACVVFAVQIGFELKGSKTSSDLAFEFVIDYQDMNVRSSRAYDQSMAIAFGSRNLMIEAEASAALPKATPPLTREDAPKIARDLGVVSIISFLFDEQGDWQIDTRSFKTSIGTTTQWQRLSTPKECSVVTASEIQQKLLAVRNVFAGVRIGMSGDKASLCLPPHAVLEISQNSVAIHSLVCSVTFVFQEPFSSMHSVDPPAVAIARATRQPINADVAKLSDGSPRYSTVVIGARTTVEFASLRAQDRDLDKYQKVGKPGCRRS
jgi:hypothetical protein